MNRRYPYQSTPTAPTASATKNNELNTAVTSAMTILAAITTPATASTAFSQVGICLPQPLQEPQDAARHGVYRKNVRALAPVPDPRYIALGGYASVRWTPCCGPFAGPRPPRSRRQGRARAAGRREEYARRQTRLSPPGPSAPRRAVERLAAQPLRAAAWPVFLSACARYSCCYCYPLIPECRTETSDTAEH